MWPMVASHTLKARVPAETKRRVQEAARQQLLTESIWLRRVVDSALRMAAPAAHEEELMESQPVARDARLYVRLTPEDRLLLRERAAARGMPSATYVSVLTRAHLRHLAPLPAEELLALKRSVAELGAMGRNLNQIARAANMGDQLATPGRDDLVKMLKVCSALRDHFRALLKANLTSWESGRNVG